MVVAVARPVLTRDPSGLVDTRTKSIDRARHVDRCHRSIGSAHEAVVVALIVLKISRDSAMADASRGRKNGSWGIKCYVCGAASAGTANPRVAIVKPISNARLNRPGVAEAQAATARSAGC